MNDVEEIELAEEILSEMLAADKAGDYQAFIQRMETGDIEDFDETVFQNDIKAMREELGDYKSRVFLGALKGVEENGCSKCLRFVWRAVYEKNEALIVLGIHERDGQWYVNENTIS